MLTANTEEIMNRPVFINDMAMMAIYGSKERHPKGIAKLLAASGFRLSRVFKVRSQLCHPPFPSVGHLLKFC